MASIFRLRFLPRLYGICGSIMLLACLVCIASDPGHPTNWLIGLLLYVLGFFLMLCGAQYIQQRERGWLLCPECETVLTRVADQETPTNSSGRCSSCRRTYRFTKKP